MLDQVSTKEQLTPIVHAFFERLKADSFATPAEALERCVSGLRNQIGERAAIKTLRPYLELRHINTISPFEHSGCDGWLKPNGFNFEDGFTLGFKRDHSRTRIRFTLAHELCHTFFYEYVPELKFAAHQRDLSEEMLCDLGAAAFLIPADSLKADAADLPVSVSTLQYLADLYDVSRPSMFLRLRRLEIWKCELSIWHRMTDERFVLERQYGGIKKSWEWIYADILQNVWHSQSQNGQTWVHFPDEENQWTARRIHFQASRIGDSIWSLWSNWPFPRREGPLFKNVKN